MSIPIRKEAKVVYIRPKNFIIPSEKEVSEYIEVKMGWPKDFSEYYGSKFWNFYQSKSWMIGRNSMKDWKACFNGQWQTIKDSRDEQKLTNSLRKATEDINKSDSDPIEIIYQKYIHHPTVVSDETLVTYYELLKEKGQMKLSKEQVEICRQMGPIKGRSQAVKFSFENRALNKKIG